jgi:hypothetical protein
MAGLPDDDVLALAIDSKNSNNLDAGTRRNGIFKIDQKAIKDKK